MNDIPAGFVPYQYTGFCETRHHLIAGTPVQDGHPEQDDCVKWVRA